MSKQSGLGRGLGALIPPKTASAPVAPSDAVATATSAPSASVADAPKGVVSGPPTRSKPTPLASAFAHPEARGTGTAEVPIASIEANPLQPRRHFDHGLMDDLIASIKEHGVLQPVLVTKKGEGKYQLIAGERRLRAATLAGLTKIPVFVREASELERLELALIENIQRQDLNPLEEAQAYEQLHKQFSLTQEDIAKKVGKSRSQISNTLRLLQLPETMKQALAEGRLSASNARTLLALESETDRAKLFEAMMANRFSVREAEEEVQAKRARPRQGIDPNIRAAEEQVRSFFACKVKIRREDKGTGEIRLRFYSDEELSAILEKIKDAN